MLAEKYFPVESSRYKRFVGLFQKLDSFFALSPDRWFSIWTIVLAGANTAAHLENRWVYWDWSTFSYLFIPILVFSIWLDRYFNKLQFFSNNIDSIQSALSVIFRGGIFFILGMLPIGFNYLTIIYGIPYIIFFLVGYMVWSIQIDLKEKNPPLKATILPFLIIITLLTILSSIIGYINDDPMISTAAAVFLPFPLVALFFPIAIRHLQRCRIYVVFIPTMFLSMRYPWLLGLLCPLFILSRHYYYFTTGKPHPTFKVDHSDEQLV